MTIKLTKTEAAEIREFAAALETAKSALLDYLTERRDEWQEEFDQKSEKWAEGENGQAAQEKIDIIETTMDEIDNIEVNIDFASLS